MGGHRSRHRAADVVVVAERLNEGDHLTIVKDRDRDAQVGQVSDPAFRAVDIVVEEHVAGLHLCKREVAGNRMNQRRIRPSGELAQQPVVNAGSKVMRIADHR